MAKLIKDKYTAWEQTCEERFQKLKSNEEELNRIFIDVYGLQGELSPSVEAREITIRKAELRRDIKSLISYAVGCWFGRYSLDCEGLCYAGGVWDASKYRTILPVQDNIILLEELPGQIIKFVDIVYGTETLEENLQFIADALEGAGTSREVLKNYLLNEFYADHCRLYRKRPIYWQFSSGRRHAFKALVYYHRWGSQTAEVLKQMVLAMQTQCREQLLTAGYAERVKLSSQLGELAHYAEKIQSLDMTFSSDDGIRINYEKLSGILEKIR